MKEQKTPEQIMIAYVKGIEVDLLTSEEGQETLKTAIIQAMQEFSDQQNVELRERVKELEKEVNDMTEFIPIYEGKIHKERCRADDAENRVKDLEALMQEFVDRVDRGEVRSKRTYAKFKEALKK